MDAKRSESLLLVAQRCILSDSVCHLASLEIFASLWNDRLHEYAHDGLAALIGETLVTMVLGQLHRRVFRQWLAMPLSDRQRTFGPFLQLHAIETSTPADLIARFETLIPDSVDPPERSLFRADVPILAHLLSERSSSLLSRHRRIVTALQCAKDARGDTGLTLAGLGLALSVSPNHFGTEFHRTSGLTFRRYLFILRMLKAASLLRSSPAGIAQVARAVGYSERSNFVRDFKKAFGTTTSDYRRRERMAYS